jgi:hypothetical protein
MGSDPNKFLREMIWIRQNYTDPNTHYFQEVTITEPREGPDRKNGDSYKEIILNRLTSYTKDQSITA